VQAAGTSPAIHVTRAQILELLGHAGLRRIMAQHSGTAHGLPADEDEDGEDAGDDDDGIFGWGYGSSRRRARTSGPRAPSPPVPSPVGQQLMESGTFGHNESHQDRLRRRKKKLARRIMNRELGLDDRFAVRENDMIAQGLLPSSKADMIVHYDTRCYSGQFSEDGNFFFSCSQDFKVRMYDTSNPYDWKYYKTVSYPFGQWTITDATLSPDNQHLAYSSIRSNVCLASTDPMDTSEPLMLDFSTHGGRRSRLGYGGSHFGIWSLRYSGDGKEIVAGTSDYAVYVYDLEVGKSILKIDGHSDDVNAVCYGDQSSPHILYSGSDDTVIKVWDRRSMGDNREAGVFIGHTEGITYVDSKGDGRYVLSNGKDQTMKLWDLRKMMSTEQSAGIDPQRYTSNFDYRFMTFSQSQYKPHPNDCSLVTFRGHSVLKTLIRCHFAPPGSTNSRYVYTGSEDGKVHIYNLDATEAGTIDVQDATRDSRPRDPSHYSSAYEIDDRGSRGAWKTCVRDASWHPNAPVISATSWNGYGMSTGTCTVHTWNDGGDEDDSGLEVGRRVDAKLKDNRSFYDPRDSNAPRRRSRLRSHFVRRRNDDEDDDAAW
jgi:WD repeat-containing protein 23